jgi:hypothetical protein
MNTSSVQAGAFAIGLEPMAPRWLTLEPAVVGAVDLNQLAQALAAQAGSVEAAAFLARQPKPILDHPSPQRLPRNPQVMPLRQRFGRQRRAEVQVLLPDQVQHHLADRVADPVVRRPPAGTMDQRRRAFLAEPLQQPEHLPSAHRQDMRRRPRIDPPIIQLSQNLHAPQLALAHRHPSHATLQAQSRQGRVTLLICS